MEQSFNVEKTIIPNSSAFISHIPPISTSITPLAPISNFTTTPLPVPTPPFDGTALFKAS